MKKLLYILLLQLVLITAYGQSSYWQQQLNYIIDVTLNDRDHTLDGFLKLDYTNSSPDTLTYIWFHLWPNAYKNDRTAFSEQLLENGRTDFYFADQEKRGYMNRLDFRISNDALEVEDHPNYIDVVKVHLDQPLAPGKTVTITTPFHVKLPAIFSRSGHAKQHYAITQWYPKPAVYDSKGWHEMPYLDQGEFYSEFGSFDVRITVPENYVVAATGELQNADERNWLLQRKQSGNLKMPAVKKEIPMQKKKSKSPVKRIEKEPVALSVSSTKTIRYIQENVHDFAWFADKNFIVDHDTLQLLSGRAIDVFAFYSPNGSDGWKQSVQYAKDAVKFRSRHIGEYPYNVVSVVEGVGNGSGGMEYPTITVLHEVEGGKLLDFIIEHEIGHNWFYGILASNERAHPWMDEGMNTFYDYRYMREKYGDQRLLTGDLGTITKKLPEDEEAILLDWITAVHKDQPISTSSEEFTVLNYGTIAYLKAGKWLQQLETILGAELFDQCMKTFYEEWKFRHPAPEDFKRSIERTSGKDLTSHFQRLDKTGRLKEADVRKKIKPTFLFNFANTDSIHYVGISPGIGYNMYDKLMAGLILHNFNIPPSRFRFFLNPLYATGSKQLNGRAQVFYHWYPSGAISNLRLGTGFSKFSTLEGLDSNANKIFGGFYKITPSLKMTFRNRYPRSSMEKFVEWKTYIIGEKGFEYNMSSKDSMFYPSTTSYVNRYLNQLTLSVADHRVLYPYDIDLQIQQGEQFYRAGVTAHYYFNYPKGGGMQVRFFAAKFGYLGGKTSQKEFQTAIYQPKLTAVRGYEDYTYSNYFIGRSEVDGLGAQQIMMRDGGLKLRTDLFQGLQGRSDNWVSSMTFNTTLPEKLFPVKLPVRLFLDIGTYAEAWEKDAETGRFLYVGGLQVSLFKDLLNIYAPIVYSKEFRDNLKSVPEENKFFKRISFSIDIQRFNLRRLTSNQIPF